MSWFLTTQTDCVLPFPPGMAARIFHLELHAGRAREGRELRRLLPRRRQALPHQRRRRPPRQDLGLPEQDMRADFGRYVELILVIYFHLANFFRSRMWWILSRSHCF